jgi:hypothetical protein
MKDLIEALTILAKYMDTDEYAPTHCEHDELLVLGVEVEKVSPEDIKRLDELGFFPNEDLGTGFKSFRFGSC